MILGLLEVYILFFFFFFQAEDGIRDATVTGVQTCALPILNGEGDALIKEGNISISPSFVEGFGGHFCQSFIQALIMRAGLARLREHFVKEIAKFVTIGQVVVVFGDVVGHWRVVTEVIYILCRDRSNKFSLSFG